MIRYIAIYFVSLEKKSNLKKSIQWQENITTILWNEILWYLIWSIIWTSLVQIELIDWVFFSLFFPLQSPWFFWAPLKGQNFRLSLTGGSHRSGGSLKKVKVHQTQVLRWSGSPSPSLTRKWETRAQTRWRRHTPWPAVGRLTSVTSQLHSRSNCLLRLFRFRRSATGQSRSHNPQNPRPTTQTQVTLRWQGVSGDVVPPDVTYRLCLLSFYICRKTKADVRQENLPETLLLNIFTEPDRTSGFLSHSHYLITLTW